MKSLFIFLFVLLVMPAFGQDTVSYTSNWTRTNYKKIIAFYGIKNYNEEGIGMATYYWKDGTLHSHQMEKNDLKHGLCIWYHKNGEKKASGNYMNDKAEGTYRFYDEQGKLKSEVEYYNGEVIVEQKGSSSERIEFIEVKNGDLDDNGTVIEFPDVDAQFPGGPDSMSAYIQVNMEYPMAAIMNEDQGKVYIKFVVERDGSLSQIAVERGVSYELDSAAITCVTSMPNWIPGEMKGKTCRTRCRLPIVFTLDNDDAMEEPKKKRWFGR